MNKTNKFSRLYQGVWYPKVGDVVKLKGYSSTSAHIFAKVVQVDEDRNVAIQGPRIIHSWYSKDSLEYVGRQYPAWVLDKISRSSGHR